MLVSCRPGCSTAAGAVDDEDEALVGALCGTLAARDTETTAHLSRVAVLAVRLAEALGWSPSQRRALRWGASLHDIGKLGILDAILLKSGQLSAEEQAVMRSHVALGLELVSSWEFLPQITLDAIRDHHERWDGRGYPAGKAQAEISLAGRMIALCDVYDSLTSERPYKVAWSPQAALAELEAQAGRHFDPLLTQVFVAMLTDPA